MKVPYPCIYEVFYCRLCRKSCCMNCEGYDESHFFVYTLCSECFYFKKRPLAKQKNNVLFNRIRREGFSGMSISEILYIADHNVLKNADPNVLYRYSDTAFIHEINWLEELFL